MMGIGAMGPGAHFNPNFFAAMGQGMPNAPSGPAAMGGDDRASKRQRGDEQ